MGRRQTRAKNMHEHSQPGIRYVAFRLARVDEAPLTTKRVWVSFQSRMLSAPLVGLFTARLRRPSARRLCIVATGSPSRALGALSLCKFPGPLQISWTVDQVADCITGPITRYQNPRCALIRFAAVGLTLPVPEVMQDLRKAEDDLKGFCVRWLRSSGQLPFARNRSRSQLDRLMLFHQHGMPTVDSKSVPPRRTRIPASSGEPQFRLSES